MRWFTIRTARMKDSSLRTTFEQHGLGTMQGLLAAHDRMFWHQGQWRTANDVRPDLLAWLTEQYDIADLKETWNLTMEAAIVVLIVVELVIMLR